MPIHYRKLMTGGAPRELKRLFFAAGLPRIIDHFKNGTMALISAFKSGRPLEENLENQWKLAQRVREMGLGYTPVIGRWGGENERTLLIPNITKEQAKQLAKEFNQDAYLWAEKGRWCVWLTNNDELYATGTTLHLIRADEEFMNYTETKKKRKLVMQSKKP